MGLICTSNVVAFVSFTVACHFLGMASITVCKCWLVLLFISLIHVASKLKHLVANFSAINTIC